MSLKDRFAKNAADTFAAIGCLAHAGFILGGIFLWLMATAWYAKTWGVLGVIANIALMPIFTIGFPFIFWNKEGVFPWRALIAVVTLVALGVVARLSDG